MYTIYQCEVLTTQTNLNQQNVNYLSYMSSTLLAHFFSFGVIY